jgi:uncharacterized membrane protein
VISRASPWHRRGYLDWLRGIGVLIMIEGHTLDSWTRPGDRGRDGYRWGILVAGFGAPLFLFLAGAALALAAGSRMRKGAGASEVSRAALQRGLWIFALAFLFRLQSWAISGGPVPRALLRVDILNVMGVSMVLGALLSTQGAFSPAAGSRPNHEIPANLKRRRPNRAPCTAFSEKPVEIPTDASLQFASFGGGRRPPGDIHA